MPIRTGQKLLYDTVPNSTDFSCVVSVDKEEIFDTSSTYHLRRYGSNIDTTFRSFRYWIEFPGPFGYEVQLEPNNIVLHDPMHMVVPRKAQMGYTWLCDSLAETLATVVWVDTITVFGTIDSAYTAELVDGRTFTFSKAHGFLQWFKDNGEPIYLSGSQDEWGTQIPTVRDIFSFSVGDVFEYTEYDSGSQGSNPSYDRSHTFQRTILSKEETENELIYECLSCTRNTSINFPEGCTQEVWTISLNSSNESFEVGSARRMLDSLEHQHYVCSLARGTMPIDIWPHRYTGLNVYRYQNDCDLFSAYAGGICSSVSGLPGNLQKGYSFGKHLGMVYHSYTGLPSYHTEWTQYEYNLVGYKHGDISYGTVHELEYFYFAPEKIFALYGTEFYDKLTIAVQENHITPFSIRLFDTQGKLLFTREITNPYLLNTIAIPEVNEGVYIVEVYTPTVRQQFRALKINQ